MVTYTKNLRKATYIRCNTKIFDVDRVSVVSGSATQ